jgi:hypothetical protein
MSKKAAQYTIRNVPPSVDRALRRKAAASRTSLNRFLLEALEREAGIGGAVVLHHDLDHLIGTWIADPAVDEALAAERNVHPGDWK